MSAVSQYEIKAIPAGQINIDEALGIIECFVAGVGNKDSVGDVVLPGAFTESLKRRKPRVVWGHDWNHPIGKVLEIYEVGASDPRLPIKMRRANIGGLFAKVQFNLKSEKGREAFNQVAFYGEEQEWSIGYKTLDAFFDPNRKANMLKEVELYEVSPVLHGANQLTGTISIKSNDPLQDPSWQNQEDTDDEYTGPRGPDGGVPAVNPAMGRDKNLSGAIAMRFGGAVRLRNADNNLAVFDHMHEGKTMIMRVTYHFDGDEFMFGEPKEVTAQTVYMPVAEPVEEESDEPMMFGDTDEKFMDFLSSIAKQIRANKKPEEQIKAIVEDIEFKAGRVLSRNNVSKLRQAIDLLTEVMATGGMTEIEMKGKELLIPVATRDISDMKLLVDDLCNQHGLEAKAFNGGIAVSGDITDEAHNEITSLIDEYTAKVLRPQRFDPKAVDGDNDGTIQEGTAFARPGAPKVPSINAALPRTAMSTTTPQPSSKSPRVQSNLDSIGQMASSPFDSDREFGDFNRRWQKHTVDGTMGSSDIVGMDRMYENLKKKAKTEGLDNGMFKQMSSQELNEFYEALAYDKMEPDTRAEFLAMLMADFELGMRKIAKNRDKNGSQAGEPKIEVDKIIGNMRSRMNK